ncbi:MATE family efflux transporter [Aquimarina aquimarini]|uniref:MATE family efflux transporter n=1 Tax=Aquimarina aquimarini TaxID=1191734 RepID=UPI000D55F786|nr:MATE family efflux transporter [Aquimarina aquimarini]
MRTVLYKTRSFFSLLWDALLGKESNFVSGNINRTIVLLSAPMVAELFMESLFVCANLFFISKAGMNAISIAGATTSVITLCYSVSIGLSIAASAVISRRIGEKNFEGAGLTAMQVIYLAVPLALLISVLCFVWTTDILHLIGLSPAMIEEGTSYSRVMFACSGFLILRITVNGVFRGAGDASTAMRTQWLSNGLNIILCPILIFGWGIVPAYGLLGVAIATGVSRMIGVCYQAWHLVKGKTVMKIGREQLIFHFGIFKKVLNLAMGGTLQFIIPASSWVFMIKIISYFGENALEGYILAQRVASIATMPAWGIANAAGILTGQNLGANQPDRAEKSVWRAGIINMGFLIIIAICWFFLARPVVEIFSNVPEIVNHSITYINFISMAYVLLGYTMVISRALNSAGQVMVVTLLYILMFYVIQIPLSHTLGVTFSLGPNGVFTAILISEIILATAFILIFRKGKWKNKKV